MSDNFSLIIKNGSCYIEGKLTKTDIGLSGHKIKKIGKIELNSATDYDATDKVVLPGIIDTQVHFCEAGYNFDVLVDSARRIFQTYLKIFLAILEVEEEALEEEIQIIEDQI